ncbi:DUF2125 domain-containing protein [Roseobacter sinensis]|uniref:DUF2125 domain-containing protein n=1 Tax=Roseobacter sinensis TaxID=2931391 RepID=A0ABT3B9G1_9RHOB|nr:DUF2125 domain-containing protein [Roseobacter sp. WL0113]MCV3270195.1 DUF2125 domain-containing protein [Roseobacter sp. WL0113]
MTFLGIRTASGGTMALLLAGAAQADVTAQDVWADWQDYMTAVGYEMTATETQSGDTLTVEAIEMTAPDLGDGSSMVMRLGQLEFRENGDGSVNVIYPDTTALEIELRDPSASDVDLDMEVRTTGMDMVVTGVPTDMTNTYAAERIEMVLTGLTVDGEEISAEDAAGRLVLDGLSGTTQSTVGGKRVYDQRALADTVSYDVRFKDPDGTGDLDLSSSIDGLNFAGSSALPLAVVRATDMSALIAAGMTANGTFGYTGGSSEISVVENGAPAFTAQTSSTGGTLNVTMGADGLEYSGDQNDLKLAMSGSQLPLPLELDMETARFNLAMPLQTSEEVQDFALGFAFNEFSISEALWSIFDPGQQLPRDPATVVLDLAGKARLLFDFLDPSAADAVTGPDFVMGEVDSVDINRLQVSVAGAELTGEGAFTLDNSAEFGPPKAVGAADLKLVGGNMLIDTLVNIGLLPEDQAMGARMMMGLLAVPGDAPDTLTSKIEINKEGHIMANGQRIQ